VDKSEKFQSRIDELLGRAKKRQKPGAPSSQPEPVAGDASAPK
jgi:hypothetical protein